MPLTNVMVGVVPQLVLGHVAKLLPDRFQNAAIRSAQLIQIVPILHVMDQTDLVIHQRRNPSAPNLRAQTPLDEV